MAGYDNHRQLQAELGMLTRLSAFSTADQHIEPPYVSRRGGSRHYSPYIFVSRPTVWLALEMLFDCNIAYISPPFQGYRPSTPARRREYFNVTINAISLLIFPC